MRAGRRTIDPFSIPRSHRTSPGRKLVESSADPLLAVAPDTAADLRPLLVAGTGFEPVTLRSPQIGSVGTKSGQSATVCVHMATDRVGVRELRQNLSRYLRRVASGERLKVTERGRPVAILGPVDESGSALRKLVASGRAAPPEGDLLDFAPPKGRISTKGTDALRELREDRP
jgi:prevent-host-death family protein